MVGPVNPPLHGYIWILVAIEYFTKWTKEIPLHKATGGEMTNFIKENIIVWFRVPHRIISDTPFVNSEVRKMLEFYQIKHHRLLPYCPITLKGMGRQRQQTRLYKDYHQDELGIYWGVSNAPARRPLSLPKLTKVSHRVFTHLFCLRNRGDGPNRNNDSLFKSNANAKERKGKGSFRGRKV